MTADSLQQGSHRLKRFGYEVKLNRTEGIEIIVARVALKDGKATVDDIMKFWRLLPKRERAKL